MALTDNLVRYYKCEEDAANTNVIDATGTGDATSTTNTSNIHTASGKILSAFTFSGSNNIDTDSAINLTTNDFSIGGWFKFPNFSAVKALFSNFIGSGGQERFNYLILTNGKVAVALIDDPYTQVLGNDTVLSTGTWHHIMFTKDATNMKLYIDAGTPASETTPSGTYGNRAFELGAENSGAQMVGEMDEIGIWSGKALSAAEISELYAGGSGLSFPFTTATTRLVKISGTFVEKPILTKVAGTFVDKPIKIKVGGTFQ